MNTNALFDPTMRMLTALKEAMETGLSRIEICYYADSKAAELELLGSNFPEIVHKDLDIV